MRRYKTQYGKRMANRDYQRRARALRMALIRGAISANRRKDHNRMVMLWRLNTEYMNARERMAVRFLLRSSTLIIESTPKES